MRYHRAIVVVLLYEKIFPTFKRPYHMRDSSTHKEAGEGRSP